MSDSLQLRGSCSPPASSVHGILQARILQWGAIPFSGGSFQPWDWTWVSCIAGRFFTVWATTEHVRHSNCWKSYPRILHESRDKKETWWQWSSEFPLTHLLFARSLSWTSGFYLLFHLDTADDKGRNDVQWSEISTICQVLRAAPGTPGGLLIPVLALGWDGDGGCALPGPCLGATLRDPNGSSTTRKDPHTALRWQFRALCAEGGHAAGFQTPGSWQSRWRSAENPDTTRLKAPFWPMCGRSELWALSCVPGSQSFLLQLRIWNSQLLWTPFSVSHWLHSCWPQDLGTGCYLCLEHYSPLFAWVTPTLPSGISLGASPAGAFPWLTAPALAWALWSGSHIALWVSPGLALLLCHCVFLFAFLFFFGCSSLCAGS